MDTTTNIRAVQYKILEIMKYVDELCRANDITYYIMGGTALGAVRHGGFIPWDDDLDIFMTPDQYEKFKLVFESENHSLFVLQEWKTTPDYLQSAKVRMNGTAFIEHSIRDRKDLHQGIYVDIMILHKCPENKLIQRILYLECKYVTLLGLSQRDWQPKNKIQSLALSVLRIMPNKILSRSSYRNIYRFDQRNLTHYCYFYWITPAKFHQGLFEAELFENPIDILFEDTTLLCSKDVKTYLTCRYGDYMKLPSEASRKAAVHAEIYDTERDYSYYVK